MSENKKEETNIVLTKNQEIYKTQLKKGTEILNENNFLRDLSNLMENPEFKSFFDKYLGDWCDVRCSIIYMKLYAELKDKYKKVNNVELNKELTVFFLKKIMSDKQIRPFSIKTIDKIYKNKRVTFFKEFEKYLSSKNSSIKILLN